MNDLTKIILAFSYVVFSGTLLHWKAGNYLLASLLAAAVATLLVFATDYIVVGEIGPFAAMAMRNAFIVYLLASFIIGAPFCLIRAINKQYK
jgi:hypothetical protein